MQNTPPFPEKPSYTFTYVRDLQEPLSAYTHELRVMFFAGTSPLVRP